MTKPERSSDDPNKHYSGAAACLAGGRLTGVLVVNEYQHSSISPRELSAAIDDMALAVGQGDLAVIERMLLEQAVALNAMFTDLAVRARGSMGDESKRSACQLALKAQNNARATMQTLIDLKAPRHVAYVQQTNVATNQQINTLVGAASGSGRLSEPTPNELIAREGIDGRQTVDRRAAR
jgi:hypothetical protein